MNKTWSKERAWEWYNAHPWLRGCNYMSADCANRIDQWQESGFEERFETTEKEFALAKETGFNTIRIIMEYIVWKEEHDGFMERLERYISLAAKYGISCMIVFGNDCMPPKGDGWKPLKLGEQSWDLGYHGGRKHSQHGTFSDHGYHLLDEPEEAALHYEMVREIVTKYKDDERIIMWDVFNEPGNSNRGTMSLPHFKTFVEIIREIDPIQPITAAVFRFTPDFHTFSPEKDLDEIQLYALEISDIVSFHHYGCYEDALMLIHKLKALGRPIVCTEWLARCTRNTVQEMFPLFFLEKIGCYCWGFVAGKYQTYEPWNAIWDLYEKDPGLDWDFTKWFHDLYRPAHRPYDPKEIELIRRFCRTADTEFAEKGESK